MRIEKLNLDHQNILSERLRNLSLPVSEYTFVSLYLFRNKHKYEVIFDDEIFIKGKTYDGAEYIMPVFDLLNADKDYIKKMTSETGMLFPIPEIWTSALDSETYTLSTNENDSDYIHTIYKMGTFSGKHLHGQKNHLNRFNDLYTHDAFPLTVEKLPDAVKILDSWLKTASVDAESSDYFECREGIELYEKLNLCGGIFYADNEPGGFIIGEELNDENFVLHFAKARREFKGIYQYMFNSFAKVMPSKYCCFNFEQDLGLENLRTSKMSYKPERMIKKYRVSLK